MGWTKVGNVNDQQTKVRYGKTYTKVGNVQAVPQGWKKVGNVRGSDAPPIVPGVRPLTKTQQVAKAKRLDKNITRSNQSAAYYKQQADQAGSFMGMMKNTITGIPQAVGTIGKEAVTHPINTARSVASGVYEGGIKPIAKLPTYLAGNRGAQARQGLDMIGNDLAGNQNQTQQDIRSGFKFGGAVAPYELAGSLASRILPKAAAGAAGFVGGGQIAYEGENTLKGRGTQAALDTLLLGLTKGAGKVLGTLKKPVAEAIPYTVPQAIPKGLPKNAVKVGNINDTKVPQSPLLQEAGKYKSVEEFVRANRNTPEIKAAKAKISEIEARQDYQDFTRGGKISAKTWNDNNAAGKEYSDAVNTSTKQLTDLWKKAQGGVKSSGSESIPKLPETAKTPLERVSQKSAEVSKKVGQDVSLPKMVEQAGTDVKSKVNILDAWRTPDRVLKKIGLEPQMNLVRKQHDAYLDELPKHLGTKDSIIDKWAVQLNPESNQKVFRFLDGEKIPLTPQEGKIAGEIKTYLKDWADRLGLPEDKRITNYITHIFDKDLIQKEFPDELAKIIDTKVAGSVYDPFMLKRLGKLGYVPDVVRALDAYAKRATRKVHMDVALEQMKKASEKLELSQFKYVKEYIDRVNLRPTELDNAVDNTIKSVVGYKLGARPTASLTQSARKWIYRGTLGLNPGSALKNLSQGANTYSKLGEKYTATGYINLIKNWKSGELERVGVLQDSFIQDRGLSAGKKLLQKFDDGLMVFFQGAEKINRGAAYYGAKAKALNEGLPEKQAIEYAKKLVRDTQFTFGSIDTPPILQSDIGKTIGQFQSFTIKQGEFLGEMAVQKDIAGLIRYALASTAYITAIGSAFGMKPQDAIPSFRFGVPPAIAPAVQGVKALLGAPNKYGQPTGWKELSKTLIPLIPAGTQINKTLGGVQSYNQGMVTNGSGNAQYPIEQDVPNFLRTLLFGKYNTPEGRKYFNDNERPLSPAQTQLLKELGPTYYEELMKKRDALAEKEKIKKFQKANQPFYTK